MTGEQAEVAGAPSLRVLVHHRRNDASPYVNESRYFLRLPCGGEYVAMADDSLWYQVTAVVHCPFRGEYGAEIWATEEPRAHFDV